MKRILYVFCILFLLTLSLSAQVRTADIFGRAVDQNGAVLPGVKVTLTGSVIAPRSVSTTGGGIFRFLALEVSDDYTLRAELAGYKMTVRSGIRIVAGVNVELTLTMEKGSESEEVMDTSSQNVLDATKSTIAATVTQELLQEPPSARDPFNTNKMAPSVTAAKEDVGGSEGGQQVAVAARGAPPAALTGVDGGSENMQIFDGLPIPWSQGSNATAFYFNFDSFKEINVTVGGSDVSSQTAGVLTNIVTHRGSNAITFSGRFYWTDQKFQLDTMSDKFRQQGLVGMNRINVIRDYGFASGGPIVKNRVWFYGSYGMQDIRTFSIYNLASDTTLETLIGKLSFQPFAGNRLEFFAQGNKKLMWGTASSSSNVEGTNRDSLFPFGYPLVQARDEQMIGDNLFVTAKYGWYNSGFISYPARDSGHVLLAIFDLREKRQYGGGSRGWTDDDVWNAAGTADYFIENMLGMSHDVKVGIEWQDRRAISKPSYPGSLQMERNFIDPTADFTGDGLADVPTDSKFMSLKIARANQKMYGVDALAGYISDNVTSGRLNLYLGLRYDMQSPKTLPDTMHTVDRSNPATTNTLTNKTIDLFETLMPPLEIPGVKGVAADGSKYSWKTLSPRISLTYDIFGDGKTLAKVSFAQYGQFMTTTEAARYQPGGTTGWMYFYWWDNGDSKADFNELYWTTIKDKKYKLYRVFDDAGNFKGDWLDGADKFWAAFTYQDPTKLDTNAYVRIDADAQDYRTTDLYFSLEKELFRDFGVQLNLVYRKYDQFRRSLKYFPATDTLIDETSYVSAGAPPANIPGDGAPGDTGEAKNHEWYYQTVEATNYSPYTWIKSNPDYTSDYYGIDIQMRKRMSNRWSAQGSVSFNRASPHWGANGVLNPTNQWALDGIDLATPWTFKLSGVYQFPYDLNFSVNLSARAGWRIDRTVFITDYRLPNAKSNSSTIYLDPTGNESLPAMFNVSIRFEKLLRLLGTGKQYIMADVFNCMNLSTDEARDAKLYGNYYIYPDASKNRFVKNINYYRLTKVLSPLVVRFGVRFTF